MSTYLTAEQVLFIHARLIAETGGAHGVRDLGLLLSAVARPKATFDERELYPDLFSKTAALFESLWGTTHLLMGISAPPLPLPGYILVCMAIV
jgi:prophage maintenance system killer protein